VSQGANFRIFVPSFGPAHIARGPLSRWIFSALLFLFLSFQCILLAKGGIVIDPATLPNGTLNVPYSETLSAAGGAAPYTYVVSSGHLPAGLTLSPGGTISGTPKPSGIPRPVMSSNFGVTATDSNGATGTQKYTLSVVASGSGTTSSPLAVTTTSLPAGTVGTAYSVTLAASGGTLPYSWTLASGSIPPGLSLSSSGVISGTPSASGTLSFTVQVTDSGGKQASATLSLTIDAALAVTTSSLPEGTLNTAYSATLAATGGASPYTWSILSGMLPAGTSLGATTGTISGTPSAAGSYNFSVQVNDSFGRTASGAINVVIASALAITTATLPNGTVGTAYSATLTSSGGATPVSWAVASGTLPAGLSLSQAGAFSGTPTAAGPFTFMVKATDALGNSATQSCTINIAALVSSGPVTIMNADLPNGVVGATYSVNLSANGGVPPYTWSVAGGSLPAGVALNSSTGLLSGTPTTAGWFGFFNLQAQDTAGNAETLQYSMIVNPAFDQYGGATSLKCSQGTGWFYAQKINNRWWLCTPQGNTLFSQAVAAVLPAGSGCDSGTGQCYNYDSVATAKYGDEAQSWGPQQNRRLQLWGFNTVGELSSGWMQAYMTCSSCAGWSSGQPVKMPSLQLFLISNYSGVDLWGYAPQPVKDIMAGVNGNYNGWRAASMDVYDPSYGYWLNNFFAKNSSVQTIATSPWTIGVFLDDTDYFYGMGAGPDFHTIPAGKTNVDLGYLNLITSPIQTFNPQGTYAGQQLLYSDPKVYAKTAMASPPATCSIATPCSLRDYLYKKYNGNIAALNTAWSSNYTTFDSSGTPVTGQVIGTGDGTTTHFTATLSPAAVSPMSLTVNVAGQRVGGDCPWWNASCQMATSGMGSVKSPAASWSANNGYHITSYVVDSNGYLEKSTVADGTSGSTAPTWSTAPGGTTTDGTVTWQNQGPAIQGGSYQPWNSQFQTQTCSGCGLPHASYWLIITYHMKPGYASTPSREIGDTVAAGTQMIVPDPCGGNDAQFCQSQGIANVATGYDVYMVCENQDIPGVAWCLPNGTLGNAKETLQASNVPFGQNWTMPTSGLTTTGAPVPPAPSTVNYTAGQIEIAFMAPPPAGAAITVGYTANGWMYGSGLMDEDGRNTAWLGTNPYCLSAATVCDGTDFPLPNANANLAADIDGWISQYSAAYFSTARTQFKKYFPNTLYLGADTMGTWGVPARKEVILGAAPYVDGATFAWIPNIPDTATSSAIYQYVTRYLGDKPLINSSYLPANPDSALWRYPESGVSSYPTQEARGQEYLSITNSMLTAQSYNLTYQWVGNDLFGLTDLWSEKLNWGMVSLSDNPYDGKSSCGKQRTDPWGYATGGEEQLPSWQPSTSYAPPPSPDPIIQVAIGGANYIFQASTSGASGTAQPAWPATPGASVTDGTLTWTNVGLKTSSGCFGDEVDYLKQANAAWQQYAH
jgi:hypothetical protein